MTEPSPPRFFAVVLRPETTLAVAMLVVVGTALWVSANDPNDIGQIVALALLVQMFAAATGYRERVLRGHFDPVLVSSSRKWVAASHWMVSVAPGGLVWLLLGAIVLAVQPLQSSAPFTPSGLVAFIYVSSLAWALALPLTRYASGVVWVVTLLILGGGPQLHTLHGMFLTQGEGWRYLLAQTAASLVCPIFLVERTEIAGTASLLLVAIVTVGIMTIGASFITMLDARLKGPS